MNELRRVQRVSCVSKCMLFHNGSKYSGVLEDISLCGALVTMTNSLPYVVRIGDTCSLLFCDDQQYCPGEYTSTVVRISTPKVGLQFMKPE